MRSKSLETGLAVIGAVLVGALTLGTAACQDDSSGGSAGSGNTGNTGNTGGSGNTGNVGGSGNTGNDGGSGNTGNDGGSGGGTVTQAEIYDVQNGTIGENVLVMLSGVVTAVVPDESSFWIQDPAGGEYSGVYIFGGSLDTSGVAVNDDVTVTGTTTEFYDYTEINISQGSIVENGTATAIVPEVLTLAEFASEPWESVLATIENVTVEAAIKSTTYGQWTVTDGTDDLAVDDWIYQSGDDFPVDDDDYGTDNCDSDACVGDVYTSITGMVFYSYSAWQIEPRSITDVVGPE